MASSRWKRFAFFDRHTLNLPSQVLEDLIPEDAANNNRSSFPFLISMVIQTAALPSSSSSSSGKAIGTFSSNVGEQQGGGGEQQQQPLAAMWSSLTACSELQQVASQDTKNTIRLPSQQDSLHTSVSSSANNTTTLSDGLVLLWIASPKTPFVHCVDITVRSYGDAASADNIEMDGWRGYFSTTSTEGEDGIVDVATCRQPRTSGQEHSPLYVACLTSSLVEIHVDPHLHLSCRLPVTQSESTMPTTILTLATPWNESQHGRATTMDMVIFSETTHLLAIGTDTGHTLIYNVSSSHITLKLTIPPPPQVGSTVSFLKLHDEKSIFCCFQKGIVCFEFTFSNNTISARHDLDSRPVLSKRLVDYSCDTLVVARPDGLYSFHTTQKVGVSPIDGTKTAICVVPPPPPPSRKLISAREKTCSYALVASTDVKSGRDAVDIYDATNKLVAFHALLSPGHKALRAVGITTTKPTRSNGNTRGGRSTAVVFTSGGSIVSLTEKLTTDKISLLVQKNLYAAAISMAYADPSFPPCDITDLYRRHAEHLYRKGDFAGAMDQYIYTIGSLESAHVIFRYLDAPKIPMLAKYLEELASRDMATPVHNELLRTCYLKLNDNEAAEKIAASAHSRSHTTTESASSLVSSYAHNPKEALATICTLEAPQAAEALVVHGAALARALPRETAGVVVSLCVGTYSPSALSTADGSDMTKLLEIDHTDTRSRTCTPYPFHLFSSAFVESPKVLRLILAHCNRNKCPLTPSLRRSLLELTLAEWNDAKRTGDTETEKLRRKEAITALTDAHCREIGDYDALVIVQLAGFSEGELLLYERLQMTPMLLARYAQDGGDRARRHMLAMCRTDPEILADVLGHFVAIASERIQHDYTDDASMNSEEEEILDDIREALALARAQGALPPVRIARILAGEGSGQFSVDTRRNEKESQQQTVPLSVALDYVGAILDDSRQDISRLKAEVEEYNQLCNSMEAEINTLLHGQGSAAAEANKPSSTSRMNIEELHSRLKSAIEEGSRSSGENRSVQSREAFWREMNQSEDRYDTIARFFAKGVIQ